MQAEMRAPRTAAWQKLTALSYRKNMAAIGNRARMTSPPTKDRACITLEALIRPA